MSYLDNYSIKVLERVKADSEFVGRKIELCTLRLEVPLTKSGQYNFPLLAANINAKSAVTERRLQNDEIFVPFAMALKHYVKDTSVKDSEIFTPVNTFVDKTVYTPQPGFDATHLEALYNADLTFTRNNVLVIPAIHTEDFKRVPNQQSAVGIQNESTDGYVPLLETKKVYGSAQNDFQLKCLDMEYLWQYPLAANKEVRLCLFLKGFKAM